MGRQASSESRVGRARALPCSHTLHMQVILERCQEGLLVITLQEQMVTYALERFTRHAPDLFLPSLFKVF